LSKIGLFSRFFEPHFKNWVSNIKNHFFIGFGLNSPIFKNKLFINIGEAVCRPTSGSMLADMFTPSGRGLANGIFSWGVYYGYGLAYVIGIYMSQLDILGYGWRSSYVISAAPGLIIGILIAITIKDPKTDQSYTLATSQVCTFKNRLYTLFIRA
jgi:MFS family permease